MKEISRFTDYLDAQTTNNMPGWRKTDECPLYTTTWNNFVCKERSARDHDWARGKSRALISSLAQYSEGSLQLIFINNISLFSICVWINEMRLSRTGRGSCMGPCGFKSSQTQHRALTEDMLQCFLCFFTESTHWWLCFFQQKTMSAEVIMSIKELNHCPKVRYIIS
jgi:hypothetical protein